MGVKLLTFIQITIGRAQGVHAFNYNKKPNFQEKKIII